MNKTLVALATAALVACAGAALADGPIPMPKPAPKTTTKPAPPTDHPHRVHTGTITSVDQKAKSFVFKNSRGKNKLVYWNAETKIIGGELAAGQAIHGLWKVVDGKQTATSITIESSKDGKASPAKS